MIVEKCLIQQKVKDNIECENIEYNIYNLKKDKNDVKKILLACHGFDSSKDSSTIRKLAEDFEKTDVPIVSFNWAGHGSNSESLTIKNCINIFKNIERQIMYEFPNAKIFLYGSSFGAYMILLLLRNNIISKQNIKYPHIFLKSPAIKMNEIFKEKLIEEKIEEYKKRGYTIKNRNKRMIIPYQFYEELNEHKIEDQNFINLNQNIIIFHGTKDEIASINDSKKLECDNIKIVEFVGAGHSFEGEDLKKMIKEMLDVVQLY